MEEYELKITISDTIQDLLKKHHYDHSATSFLNKMLTQLLRLYKKQTELKSMKFYLSEIQKSKNPDPYDMIQINDLFNQFILTIKKDSAMERYFCYSDCETEKTGSGIQADDESTRGSIKTVKKKDRCKKISKVTGK